MPQHFIYLFWGDLGDLDPGIRILSERLLENTVHLYAR